MTSAEPAIRASNIRKSFGAGQRRSQILHGVSLEVTHGETVFLVGPSGGGKTTLLSILGCILTSEEGTVEVLGQDVSRLDARQLTAFRRDHLGFVFQTFNLFPTLSALDNVRLTLTMRGMSLKQATTEATRVLGQVRLDGRAHLRPGHLSTGECQRVAIARALACSPAIVFADEPTASLDAENGRNVLLLLRSLAQACGTTLVVVTHDTRIFPFADRILTLEDGRLSASEATPPWENPLAKETPPLCPLLDAEKGSKSGVFVPTGNRGEGGQAVIDDDPNLAPVTAPTLGKDTIGPVSAGGIQLGTWMVQSSDAIPGQLRNEPTFGGNDAPNAQIAIASAVLQGGASSFPVACGADALAAIPSSLSFALETVQTANEVFSNPTAADTEHLLLHDKANTLRLIITVPCVVAPTVTAATPTSPCTATSMSVDPRPGTDHLPLTECCA